VTNVQVRLTVTPQRVLASRPEDIWVSFPPPAQTSTANIIESFCCHVHFLAGQEVAAQWVNGRERALALDLDDAFELGRLATRAMAVTGGDR
jgi:alkylmercury lyase